jgi:hypothetical protein
MSHLLSPVATSLDHSGKVCLSSVHSNASEPLRMLSCGACSWRNCSRDYGSQGHVNPGISQQTVAHVAFCAQACSQLAWGGSVDVFHQLTWLLCNICVCQVSIVSTRSSKSRCTRSTPSGVRGIVHLSQVSSTLKTNKDLDPIYVLVFVIV